MLKKLLSIAPLILFFNTLYPMAAPQVYDDYDTANYFATEQGCKNKQLWIACEEGYDEKIEKKIADGADPVFQAVRNGLGNVKGELVPSFVFLRWHRHAGNSYTPLHIASQLGHTRCVRALIPYLKNLKVRNSNWISIPYISKTLSQNNSICLTAVILNLMKGVLYASQLTLGDSRAIDAQMEDSLGAITPLHLAAGNGHVAIVKELLKNNADVNACDFKYRDLSILRALHYGYYNATPLHVAAHHGHTGCVVELLNAGANIKARSRTESTPLHYACMIFPEQLLGQNALQPGILFEIIAEGYNPSVFYSTRPDIGDSSESVQVLIDRGADIEVKDFLGMTPLHWASLSTNYLNVRRLLEAGAKIMTKDELEAGGKAMAEDGLGKNVLDAALRKPFDVGIASYTFDIDTLSYIKNNKFNIIKEIARYSYRIFSQDKSFDSIQDEAEFLLDKLSDYFVSHGNRQNFSAEMIDFIKPETLREHFYLLIYDGLLRRNSAAIEIFKMWQRKSCLKIEKDVYEELEKKLLADLDYFEEMFDQPVL